MLHMTDNSLAPGDRDGLAPRAPFDTPSDSPAVPSAADPSDADPLADCLAALRRDGCFRVDAVLKTSPVEET